MVKTGNNQQLIDTLVRSVEGRGDQDIERIGQELVANWGGTQGAESGMLLKFTALDPDFRDIREFLASIVSESRLQELELGQRFSEEEIRRWAQSVADRAFEDDGEGIGWDVAEVRSSDGTHAFVAQVLQGGPWEGVDAEFIGVFPSLSAATEAVKQLGYLDADDFGRRHPSAWIADDEKRHGKRIRL